MHIGAEKGEKPNDPDVIMVDQREAIGHNVKVEEVIKKLAEWRA